MELECQLHQFCSWFFSGQLLVELLTASSLFTACLRCTIFFLRVSLLICLMLLNLIYNAPSVRPQMWLARVEQGQLTLLTLAFILHKSLKFSFSTSCKLFVDLPVSIRTLIRCCILVSTFACLKEKGNFIGVFWEWVGWSERL